MKGYNQIIPNFNCWFCFKIPHSPYLKHDTMNTSWMNNAILLVIFTSYLVLVCMFSQPYGDVDSKPPDDGGNPHIIPTSETFRNFEMHSSQRLCPVHEFPSITG
ncbi:hypothetical protein JTB14_024968 [Gonioctena quinquepunctata]|nr:hypothetical protein JTB14_024968 [Gonioctena quinquepunctata]